MWLDRVSKPGPMALELYTLLTVLHGLVSAVVVQITKIFNGMPIQYSL